MSSSRESANKGNRRKNQRGKEVNKGCRVSSHPHEELSFSRRELFTLLNTAERN